MLKPSSWIYGKTLPKNCAESISRETGTECVGLESNVLDKDILIRKRKRRSLQRFGRIDILINGAGGNSPEATTKIEQIMPDSARSALDEGFFGLKMEGFRKVFDLNFMGTLLPTMVFAEEMVKRAKGRY